MLEFTNQMNRPPQDDQDELFASEDMNSVNSETDPQPAEQVTTFGNADAYQVSDTPRTIAPQHTEVRMIHKLPQWGSHKGEDFSDEEKLEVSRILTEAREENFLTINDVADTTKISTHYLQALENGDFGDLPKPVYVLAYVRKLCELYNIDDESEEQLVRPWQNIQHGIPENLPDVVYPDEDCENSQVIRKLESFLFAGAAIIILGLVIFGVVLLVSHIRGKDRPAISGFDENRLLELQKAPKLTVPGVELRTNRR